MSEERIFVVRVADKDKTGFYATDDHSGGWPYIADSLLQAKKFYSIKDVPLKEQLGYGSYQIFELKAVPLSALEAEQTIKIKRRILELEKELVQLKGALK